MAAADRALKSMALVVANDPRYSHWLVQCLGHDIEVHLVRATSGLPDIAGASLAFVEIEDDRPELGAQMVDQLLDRNPDLPVFAVGNSGASQSVLAAVRAGAKDYFVREEDDENLSARVSKVLRRITTNAPGRNHASQGQLITLMTAQSNLRNAFVGGHLALAIDENLPPNEHVLLIDVGTPTGCSLVYFNVNQSYNLLDGLNDVYRCDQTLIDTAFARHSSGLFVLSLPEDSLGFPALDDSDLMTLVETLRNYFAAIVISVDGHLPMNTIGGLISHSTRSLLVTDQSILRSRHNKHLLKKLRLDDVPLDRTGLVVDCYRKRVGLEPDNLAELLNLPVFATLGGQHVQQIHAMNAGESMFSLAPRDAFCGEVRALAGSLVKGESLRPQQQGFFARLLG